MKKPSLSETASQKESLRKEMKKVRRETSNRVGRSKKILSEIEQKFLSDSCAVCIFVSKEPEVETHRWIKDQLSLGKNTIVVPFCEGNILKLYQIDSWDQLDPSQFGLLEPSFSHRESSIEIQPELVDLFLVPGLAFDHQGNRLGYGKGFYDRLLSKKRKSSPAVALAFSTQIVSSVPSEDGWDRRMDFVQTEIEFIECG